MLNDIEATIKFYNAFYNVYFACEKKEIISTDLNGLSHNAITMIYHGFLLGLGASGGDEALLALLVPTDCRLASMGHM